MKYTNYENIFKFLTKLTYFSLQKISKRLHLSKVKLSKFNESSQLIVFYTLSALWAIDIIIR